MNLKSELKGIVEPKWDCFLELDFNAAEIRTMISLMGQEQPQEDIHEWNIKNIFKEDLSRAEAKQKFFAWLTIRKTKLSILNSIAKTFSSKSIIAKNKKKYGPRLVEGQVAIDFTRLTISYNPLPPITASTASTKSKSS